MGAELQSLERLRNLSLERWNGQLKDSGKQLVGGGPARGKGAQLVHGFLCLAVAMLIVVGGVLLSAAAGHITQALRMKRKPPPSRRWRSSPEKEAGDEKWCCRKRSQAYVESPIYARTNGYLRKVVFANRQPPYNKCGRTCFAMTQ